MEMNKKLTPENAQSRGYEWVQDVIYDSSAPAEVMGEFHEYENKGYLLGQPASLQSPSVYVGLYRPL